MTTLKWKRTTAKNSIGETTSTTYTADNYQIKSRKSYSIGYGSASTMFDLYKDGEKIQGFCTLKDAKAWAEYLENK